jgi:ABC-type Fe3+-hydroxamate transport system substrate-binding protein
MVSKVKAGVHHWLQNRRYFDSFHFDDRAKAQCCRQINQFRPVSLVGYAGNLIELAGGRNTIDNSEGVVIQVSLETIIEEDPEVIITSQSSSWPTPSKDTILSDERWEDITAVKEGKVMDIEGNWIDRTGPDLIKGLEAINEALYPETG